MKKDKIQADLVEGREEEKWKWVLSRWETLGKGKTGCAADGHLLAANFYGMVSETQESERKDPNKHTGEKEMDCKCEMRSTNIT